MTQVFLMNKHELYKEYQFTIIFFCSISKNGVMYYYEKLLVLLLLQITVPVIIKKYLFLANPYRPNIKLHNSEGLVSLYIVNDFKAKSKHVGQYLCFHCYKNIFICPMAETNFLVNVLYLDHTSDVYMNYTGLYNLSEVYKYKSI